MFCQKCGTQNEEVARFCANCGETLELGTSSNNQQGSAASEMGAVPEAGAEFIPTPAPEDAKPNNKKIIKTAIIAVAAIVIVILGFNIFKGIFGSKKVNYEKHPVVYNKDGDIMVQLAGKANADKAYELGSSDDIASVKVTDDGKYIFYGDDYDDGEYDLYYRKANDTKGRSAKEIASGVEGYIVAGNGKFVIYQKGSKVYFSNLKDSNSFAKDVEDIGFTSDYKYIIYTEEDSDGNELYIRKATLNAEPVKVDDEVEEFYLPYNEDTYRPEYKGDIYYKKDGNLYYAKNGKNPVKVLSDVGSVAFIDGKAFATTVDTKEYSYDEVYDDDYERRPGMEDVEYIGDDVYVKSEYKLYTLNGKKSKAIDGEFTYVSIGGRYAKNEDEYFIIKADGKLVNIGKLDDDVTFEYVSSDYKYVYLIEDVEEEGKNAGLGTLNSYKLGNKGLGKKTEIAKDVSYTILMDNDALRVYTRDGEDSILNVYYKNKYYEDLGENIEMIYQTSRCDKTFYFYDEYDDETGEGTLMRYTYGKKDATKIFDDVHSVEVRSDKMVYFIADWDKEDGCGKLYLVKGNGKAKEVDDEVSSIWW